MEVAGEEVANSWPAPVTPLCGVRVVVPGADMRTFAHQETILGSPQLVKYFHRLHYRPCPELIWRVLKQIPADVTYIPRWGWSPI